LAAEGGPIAQAAVELVADFDRFPADVKDKVRRAAQDAGKNFDRDIKKETDSTGADVGDKTGRDVDRKLGEGGKKAGISWSDAFKNAIALRISSSAISTLMGPLTGVGKLLGLSVAAAGGAAAAASLVQFAASLAPLPGLLLAVPAGALAGAAAMSTLKVATAGMGDAFAAAMAEDPKKYADAVKTLAPPARKVANELRTLRPELDGMRKAVQGAFFAPLVGELTAVAGALAGPVRTGMVGVADSSGKVAAGLADIAKQQGTVDLVSKAFDTTRQAVDNVNPGVQAIATGLRDLGSVGLPLLTQMSAAGGGLAVQFGEWLSRIAASGQATAWLQQALAVVRQFGALLMQIGGIIGAVFNAAQAQGSGLLGTLTTLAAAANQFLSSAQGQTALANIFGALHQVSAALMPILAGLLVQLGRFAPMAAQIAVSLGPGLASLVTALGGALVTLGPALGVVATALTQGLVAAGPGIASIASAATTLLTALTPLLPLFGQLVAMVGGVLAQAVTALLPAINTLVNALIAGLGPILPVIANALGQVLGVIGPLASELAPIIGFFLKIAASTVGLALRLIAGALQLILIVIGAVVDGVGAFFGWITSIDLGSVAAAIGNAFAAMGSFILDFFINLPMMILTALGMLGQALWFLFTTALGLVFQAIGAGIALIIITFTRLPGLIVSFLIALPGMVRDLFVAVFVWAVSAVVAGAQAVGSWFASLPSKIWAFLSALPGIVGGAFIVAFNAAVSAVAAGISAVISWVSSLPGKVGAFAGQMLNAGKALIGALFNGLQAVGGFIGDVGAAIVNGIKNAINWVIDKINSGISAVWPSSLFGAPPHIPRLAEGAIVEHRMIAEIGEAGKEVVIPLTRPRRAVELAEKSGLIQLLADRGVLAAAPPSAAVSTGPQKVVNVHAPIEVHSHAANPEFAARRAHDHIVALAQA
jgi:phage-related protein